jgi:hypothetical protein
LKNGREATRLKRVIAQSARNLRCIYQPHPIFIIYKSFIILASSNLRGNWHATTLW